MKQKNSWVFKKKKLTMRSLKLYPWCLTYSVEDITKNTDDIS
jgi:hypothetical protein